MVFTFKLTFLLRFWFKEEIFSPKIVYVILKLRLSTATLDSILTRAALLNYAQRYWISPTVTQHTDRTHSPSEHTFWQSLVEKSQTEQRRKYSLIHKQSRRNYHRLMPYTWLCIHIVMQRNSMANTGCEAYTQNHKWCENHATIHSVHKQSIFFCGYEVRQNECFIYFLCFFSIKFYRCKRFFVLFFWNSHGTLCIITCNSKLYTAQAYILYANYTQHIPMRSVFQQRRWPFERLLFFFFVRIVVQWTIFYPVLFHFNFCIIIFSQNFENSIGQVMHILQ